MLHVADGLRQNESGRQDGNGTDWHIHVEDPAPAPIIGNPTAECWPDNRGKTENRHDQTLPFTAFGRWKDIANDGHSDWHHRAGSQALNAKVDNQLGHVLTGTCQRRANQEDDHTEDKECSPTINVGELAPDGYRDRRCEQIGRDDPGVVIEASQTGNYMG